MKEIWKLLELLNEYSKNIWYFNEEDLQWQTKAWILSKEFWWVNWLVENDKIDTDPIRTRVKRVYVELEPREFTPQDFVDRVIMLLSISSSPIDDLISYLK